MNDNKLGRTTVEELCDLVAVQRHPAETPDARYVGLEHVASGRLRWASAGKASEVQSHKYAFQRNDVLYGKLRPYLDKAVLADGDGLCTTELLVLRAKPDVDPRFLACVVHAPGFVEHAMAGVTGAHHPRTSWIHIAQFELPKYAPEAQRTVAAILWRVHDLLVACEASTAKAQALKQVSMRELFTRGLRAESRVETDFGVLPESWRVEPVSAHHSVVSGGTPSRSNPAYWLGGTIPWVKTTEVNYCAIDQTEEHITQAGLDESAAKLLPAGTLLLAMYGQGVTRGRVAILGIDAACNQACAAIRSVDESIEGQYLYHYLVSRYEAIRQLAHGGQQQNLNLDIVRTLPVAYPVDKTEQRDMVAILDAIDRKVVLQERKRAVLEDLFKALLSKLMAGEIALDDLDLSALDSATSSAEEAMA